MTGDHVLLEEGPDRGPVLFAEPRERVVAHTGPEALAALDRLEQARRAGAWIAGAAAYELGFALDPAVADLLTPGPEPLLSFGIFDGPADPAPLLAQAGQEAAQVRLRHVTPLWSPADHAARFHVIKEMLAAGDLYQVNLTLPVEVGFDGTPLGLWGAMRALQPVGHGGLLHLGGQTVLSRSPELFFRLDAQGRAEVAPMKGTAPRDADPQRDATLRETLGRDIKNRAENIMIVDLMRNDLSRICRVGSVRVPELLKVETYATLHQMISRVEGQLAGAAALPDLMRALFPCGSITGAPKIAAMRAIHRLEGWRRGMYCGSMGWMAPDGRASFNVAIRTLTVTGLGTARMGVGGGIVMDSEADAEYQEALWKSRFVTGLIPPCA
ncbi:aminodeoxychorismate synthase component I [Salipiger marinus]|uniref:aminodeoxychorismate synthase component I n=1 Tax=Salipiger marinus TaxID=555512 RepID=UPI004057EF67